VVAIAYRLSGVSKVQLDGPTLAGIYLGHVKQWNDSAHRSTEHRRQSAEHRDHGRAPL
jgi:ABC-type phosphate transport system substrate-binding protein